MVRSLVKYGDKGACSLTLVKCRRCSVGDVRTTVAEVESLTNVIEHQDITHFSSIVERPRISGYLVALGIGYGSVPAQTVFDASTKVRKRRHPNN